MSLHLKLPLRLQYLYHNMQWHIAAHCVSPPSISQYAELARWNGVRCRIKEKARRVKDQELAELNAQIDAQSQELAQQAWAVLGHQAQAAVGTGGGSRRQLSQMPNGTPASPTRRPYVTMQGQGLQQGSGGGAPAEGGFGSVGPGSPGAARTSSWSGVDSGEVSSQSQLPPPLPPVYTFANSDNISVRAAARRVQAALARELG